MIDYENLVCIRPDGKVCRHGPEQHMVRAHGLTGASYCEGCMIEAGLPLYGPYVHEWNPHVWTAAGPVQVEADRSLCNLSRVGGIA